nr:TonB-dependent receptor [Litorivivens lipolytica]
MEIDVFSVTKTPQPWRRAAAATYVLTGDDIRRAGVSNLPDALKLVPGLTVAQVDAHTWAVTARGFNSTLADKLEVLLDGRSLYTPLFSGVYWHKNNIPLGDVERIEVIRGPGAALWGANAVNGVINIVTRRAGETQGNQLAAGASHTGERYAYLRSGFSTESAASRLYVKGEAVSDYRTRSGRDAEDGYDAQRVGFRSDLTVAGGSELSLQGETYRDSVDRLGGGRDEEQRTDFLMATLSAQDDGLPRYDIRLIAEASDYDINGLFHEDRDTFSAEYRHHFHLGERHQVVAGLGYHLTKDEIESPNLNSLAFLPESARDETYDVYVQDVYTAIPDRLKLTFGVKAEHNDYSGLEIQPSLRLAYTPDDETTYWSALSRAVRIPTRLDHDFVIYAPQPAPAGIVIIRGSEDFEAEELIAWEAGYRNRINAISSVDLALFYNRYDELRGVDSSAFPALISNEGEGDSSGAELVLNWNPNESFITQLGYSYHHVDFERKRGSTDTSIANANRNDPRHQGFVRVNWRLNKHVNLDVRLRNVSELPDLAVAGYTEMDATLNWQISEGLSASLLGKNLLDPQHAEFRANNQRVEIPRTVQLNLRLDF